MFDGMTIAPMMYGRQHARNIPSRLNYVANAGKLVQAMLETRIDPTLERGSEEYDKARTEMVRLAIQEQLMTNYLYQRKRKNPEWLDPEYVKRVTKWLKKKIASRQTGEQWRLRAWGSIDMDSTLGPTMNRLAWQHGEGHGTNGYQQTTRDLLKWWAIRQAATAMDKEIDEAINVL